MEHALRRGAKIYGEVLGYGATCDAGHITQPNEDGIFAAKSMTGHLLGAGGAMEAIVTLLSIDEGILPPNINHKVEDEECDLNIVKNNYIEQDISYAISNSLGFCGHNASILFKKWED